MFKTFLTKAIILGKIFAIDKYLNLSWVYYASLIYVTLVLILKTGIKLHLGTNSVWR